MHYDRHNEMDRTVTFLEKSVKNEEEKLKNHNGHSHFSPAMMGLISDTVHKMQVPIAGLENLIRSGQEVSQLVLKKIEKEIRKDPQMFAIKVVVGVCILGAVASAFRKKSKSKKEAK